VVLWYNQETSVSKADMKNKLAKVVFVISLTLGGMFFYAGKTSEHYLDRIKKLIGGSETVAPVSETILPKAEGAKETVYDWKYKGRNYSLKQTLYDSFFQFYEALPAELIFRGEAQKDWQEKNNALFLRETAGDETLTELVGAIKSLGAKNKLSENQIAELAVAFVQTIPYDYAELEEIARGTSKVDYPYAVLYENKGICSDKSFLAYALLKKLGFGVSIFLFAEDRHMAVGIKCSPEYSDYASGYCFVETTGLGNKIGAIPEILPQNRIALANQEMGTFGDDQLGEQPQPLGRVEIMNEAEGKTYTGIIDTFNTQKEIDNLKIVLNSKMRELKNLSQDVQESEAELVKMEKELKRLSRNKEYEKYNDLVAEYNRKLSAYKKEIKNYNQKVEEYNKLTHKYNQLVKSF